MRKTQTILLTVAIVLMGAAGIVATAPVSVGAATCPSGNARLLTFPAWYNGLVEEDCSMKKLGNGDDELRNLVFRIALNIVEIILQLVAYATIVFLIKGGFDYMTSTGDASKIGNAKNTIERALIGLVIALAAVAIVNLVARAV